jgi:SNF2 family DNA or RNA helicase
MTRIDVFPVLKQLVFVEALPCTVVEDVHLCAEHVQVSEQASDTASNLMLFLDSVAELFVVRNPRQKQSVMIHHIVCKDTHDENVLASIHEKDATQSSLLSALKKFLDKEAQRWLRSK